MLKRKIPSYIKMLNLVNITISKSVCKHHLYEHVSMLMLAQTTTEYSLKELLA